MNRVLTGVVLIVVAVVLALVWRHPTCVGRGGVVSAKGICLDVTIGEEPRR